MTQKFERTFFLKSNNFLQDQKFLREEASDIRDDYEDDDKHACGDSNESIKVTVDIRDADSHWLVSRSPGIIDDDHWLTVSHH